MIKLRSPGKELKRKKKKLAENTIEEEGTHPYHEPYAQEGIIKE